MSRSMMHAFVLAFGLLVSAMAHPAIDGTWSEEFESCMQADYDALGEIPGEVTCGTGAGLQVYLKTYTRAGLFLFGHCCFPAPNAAAQANASISELAVGEGGVHQGSQQLMFYNDYNNHQHATSTDVMETDIFTDWTIDAADLDKTWVFRFSYKQGDITADTTGLSTAHAFIRTVAPFLGYAETIYLLDTNNGAGQWQEGAEISLYLDGSIDNYNNTSGAPGADNVPDMQGQIFQVGFTNTASENSPSAMFYDNLSVFELVDTDGDGVVDTVDNCIDVYNTGQEDTDADGHGNICDGDFNNDCFVNPLDLGDMKVGFGGADPELDLNSDGFVNPLDLGLLKIAFGGNPGPSSPGSLCNP